jgi:hypothetical protein
MTFYCKNFDCNLGLCNKLHGECIPGRPGCVLEGKVKFSESIEERLRELAEKKAPRRRNSRGQRIEPDTPGRRRRSKTGED